ncbi:hypothetical protein RND71_029539 [Anisodus tanguticus]|uniref:Photosynthetic NDH subunit of subcomplex B 1, chloroplastic n=1 Tax=Anisodus tanguticus TaxID=243964 RepID=A0AAE1RFN6_9SOLA|nr:hypothetical protein RND71_029539 [Anisodus tanguticus]
MATTTTTTLLPKSIPHFLTNRPYFPITHVTNVPFLINNPLDNTVSSRKSGNFRPSCKKKNQWLDPFDYGDDPEMEYGSLFADGKQDEDPRPPDNPDNPYGFLKFPMGYSVEIASLGLKIRGDVRRCCCVIDGGVYENLLFFPTIQMIKDRWANAYDLDDDFPEPAEYTDMVGILKSRYYDMILSTKLAGIGHAVFLFMSTARDRVSYIYPNVNSAGAGLFLSETFTSDSMNLSEGGYHMYRQMVDWLGRPARKVPRQPLPPLKVSISKKLREVVEAKYKNAGAQKGKYIVIHGIKSDSKASMQSRGDADSLLPIEIWANIAEEIRKRRCGRCSWFRTLDASIVFITTPGQLAALVDDSAGVIATNTAAIQLAHARGKPSIGLFCSEDKARSFVPNAEEKKCATISSKTGKLVDITLKL